MLSSQFDVFRNQAALSATCGAWPNNSCDPFAYLRGPATSEAMVRSYLHSTGVSGAVVATPVSACYIPTGGTSSDSLPGRAASSSGVRLVIGNVMVLVVPGGMQAPPGGRRGPG